MQSKSFYYVYENQSKCSGRLVSLTCFHDVHHIAKVMTVKVKYYIVHCDLLTYTLACFNRHFSRVGGIAAVRKFCTDYT